MTSAGYLFPARRLDLRSPVDEEGGIGRPRVTGTCRKRGIRPSENVDCSDGGHHDPEHSKLHMLFSLVFPREVFDSMERSLSRMALGKGRQCFSRPNSMMWICNYYAVSLVFTYGCNESTNHSLGSLVESMPPFSLVLNSKTRSVTYP